MSSDSDIEAISLSYDDYNSGKNVITLNDLLITDEQLTKAKTFFYAKKDNQSGPKHLEKIRQVINGLLNAIHKLEPIGNLETEKVKYCPISDDYNILISNLRDCYIRFAKLDPKKFMKKRFAIPRQRRQGNCQFSN